MDYLQQIGDINREKARLNAVIESLGSQISAALNDADISRVVAANAQITSAKDQLFERDIDLSRIKRQIAEQAADRVE